jgi:hypothetical protein
VQKGALIGLDPFNVLASQIVFQYNPETLTRSLAVQSAGGEAAQGEALRLKGPPRESITVSVEIDAADQLERGGEVATRLGIHPALAALEMLLYPKSSRIVANETLARAGILEVIPPEAPLTLFIWGAKRVLPVRLTSFSVTEEAFDPNLNPILAKVDLGLEVLNYQDLGMRSLGGNLFMAHQVAKEVMASVAGAENVAGNPMTLLNLE